VNLTVTSSGGNYSEIKTDYITVSQSSEPYGGVIPAVDNVYLKVANDDGARFDDFGNDTFRIKWSGGGLNAVHIAQGTSGFGEITSTNSMTGTFYVTETGGRGYHDAIYLCVAVNGTIPDDFRIHIKADGYTWTLIRHPTPNRQQRISSMSIRPSMNGSTRTISSTVRRSGDLLQERSIDIYILL
jgi:PKD repeat protein